MFYELLEPLTRSGALFSNPPSASFAGFVGKAKSMGHSSVKTTEVYLHLEHGAEENPSLYLQPFRAYKKEEGGYYEG